MSKLGHYAKGALYGTASAATFAMGVTIKSVAGIYDKVMGNASHSKEAFRLSKDFLDAAIDEIKEGNKESW